MFKQAFFFPATLLRTGTISRRVVIVLIAIAFYLAGSNLLHRLVFPEQKPAVATWFKPGQKLYSKTEGFRQTVVQQKNGYVHCRLTVEPYAAGPPKHIHTDFDETFRIENGELTVWVDGATRKIRPGDVLLIPKGTPHKPYNETGDTIRLKGAIAFPEKFAFNLAQVYGVMDSRPGFQQAPDMAFHMAMFQSSGFDSYIAEGPPVFIQKAMSLALVPALRIFGYKSYYKEYDPFVM